MAGPSEKQKNRVSLQTDVLLITATEVEARAVVDLFEKELSHPFKREHIGDKTYFDLGIIADARVMMVQSEMGAGGPGGALLVVDEGIRELSPSAVILVGIAFGIDTKKHSIGDILVSWQLFGYELQKIATSNGQEKIIARGDRPQASTRLLDRFRAGIFDWREPKVDFGLILSGDKLIDSLHFRNQVLELAPEAIGGEMEGIGLYSAAQRRKVDWIVVKAICDWADGDKQHDKEQRQKLAAENAVRFTLHVLRQGGLNRTNTAPPLVGTTGKVSPPLAVGSTLRTYDIHSSWVVAVAWEPNGTRIASAGGDGTVQVWEAETGKTLLTYRGHTWWLAKANWQPTIYNVAWSPEGLRIASAGDGANVYVWNATTGQTLSVYQGHSGLLPNVYAIAWSSDGKQIASACSSTGVDKTVHVWDVNTARTITRYDARYGLFNPNFSVLAVAWSPDGTRIAAACRDNTIRVWNVSTGRCIATHQTTGASDIAWSPDSTRIASAHTDHTGQVWNTMTGEHTFYRGHTDSVRYIAWSPDGTRIATASNDITVQIWDPVTSNRIYTYRDHTDLATSVAWSPDGTRVASGGNDKTVRIWQVR